MIGVDRKWGIPMTIILSIFALLLTSPSAYAQAALVERIRFTEYGIYTVDRDVQGRDVLGINRAAAALDGQRAIFCFLATRAPSRVSPQRRPPYAPAWSRCPRPWRGLPPGGHRRYKAVLSNSFRAG